MNETTKRQKQKETGKQNNFPQWYIHHKGMSSEDIRRAFLSNLEYNIAKDRYSQTLYDEYLSLSYSVRERLIERWISSRQQYHRNNVKRVYYLSMEFLLGRLLADNILNLKIGKSCKEAINDLKLNFEDIIDQEHDAGLGNGGLGRLAACYLDSMATLKLPAVGYGIRYDFGIFNQKIINGQQLETPELWLQYINPWEIERPEYKVKIKYYGKTMFYNEGGNLKIAWIDTEDVIALPYDIPVPGYGVNIVNTLRRSEEHKSELQSRPHVACRLLLEKKKKNITL